MTRAWQVCLAAAVTVALTAATTRISYSQAALGLDIDGGFPLGDDADVADPGFGVELRFAWRFTLSSLVLRPELILDYQNFSLPGTDDAFADLLRVGAGGRLGYDDRLVPYAYGHVGYGVVAPQFGDASFGGSQGGLTWDVGVGWEPIGNDAYSLGLHVAYKSADLPEDDRFNYIAVGIHGELFFR